MAVYHVSSWHPLSNCWWGSRLELMDLVGGQLQHLRHWIEIEFSCSCWWTSLSLLSSAFTSTWVEIGSYWFHFQVIITSAAAVVWWSDKLMLMSSCKQPWMSVVSFSPSNGQVISTSLSSALGLCWLLRISWKSGPALLLISSSNSYRLTCWMLLLLKGEESSGLKDQSNDEFIISTGVKYAEYSVNGPIFSIISL